MSEATTLKLYLAEKVPFTLYPMLGVHKITASTSLLTKNPVIINLVEGDPDPEGRGRAICDKLTAAFKNQPLNWTISLQAQNLPQSPRCTTKKEFHVTIDSSLDIAEIFRTVTGSQSKVSLTVRLFEKPDKCYLWKEFETDEMAISPLQRGKIFCADAVKKTRTFVALTHLARSTDLNRNTSGEMDLIVTVENLKPIKHLAGPSTEDKMVVNKRILEEEIASDVVIFASNGAEVKCHRSFLAAHSDVFRIMFATDMQEAITGKIEMPDMSEEGVKALLAYLYHWDFSKADKSFAVAVELLKAGHKYNIRILESDIHKLLISKPEDWFEVDVAISLFLFVESFDAQWEELKKKTAVLLKKNAPQLHQSSTCLELFKKDPQAAIRLFQYTFSV